MAKTYTTPAFDPDTYVKITLNDLVIYSAYYLHKRGSEITAEDIISACFVLFPKRFSLRKFPQWPDSGIVSRRWSDCKSKGYLRGGAASGFQITAKGIRRAEKIEKSLGRLPKPVPAPKSKALKPTAILQTVPPELKKRAGRYVRSIEMSDAYRHYKKQVPLNEFDFRSLLLCTLESPPATLARNLNQFKEYVNIHNRKDLSTFLAFCEDKFSYMLEMTKSKK